MSEMKAVDWINDLESSLRNVENFKNSLQFKLKALMAMLQSDNNKVPLIDYDEENFFTALSRSNDKKRDEDVSSLNSARSIVKDIAKAIKNDLQQKKEEYVESFNKLNDEMTAVANIENFLSIWENRLKSDNSLEKYPDDFFPLFNRVRDCDDKEALLEEIGSINPIAVLEEAPEDKCEKSVLKEVNKDFTYKEKVVPARGPRFSILDYTTINDTKNSFGSGAGDFDLTPCEEKLIDQYLEPRTPVPLADEEQENVDNDEHGDPSGDDEGSEEEENVLNRVVNESNTTDYEDEDKCPSIDGFNIDHYNERDSEYGMPDDSYHHPSIDDRSIRDVSITFDGSSGLLLEDEDEKAREKLFDMPPDDEEGNEDFGNFSALDLSIQENSAFIDHGDDD